MQHAVLNSEACITFYEIKQIFHKYSQPSLYQHCLFQAIFDVKVNVLL